MWARLAKVRFRKQGAPHQTLEDTHIAHTLGHALAHAIAHALAHALAEGGLAPLGEVWLLRVDQATPSIGTTGTASGSRDHRHLAVVVLPLTPWSFQ